MIEVSNLQLELDDAAPLEELTLKQAVAKKLSLHGRDVVRAQLTRKSVDARKKSHVHFVVSVAAELSSNALEACAIEEGYARPYTPYRPIEIEPLGAAADTLRPVIVGAGPAGLFASLYLAKAGLKPLVIEQGPSVDERARVIEETRENASLDLHANIQFGEGGAGTFSDGKLTTGIKSPYASDVLHWFVDAGAPESILVDAKPHIGTDVLRGVVKDLRQRIIDLGGEIRFDTKLVDISLDSKALSSLVIQLPDGQKETIPVKTLVLACGHSARDTFELLYDRGFKLEQKPFSIGVRIEHPQVVVNQSQYGKAATHVALGAADYKLSVQVPDVTSSEAGAQRGVYTFCMCPGGEVVCASSEPETVVTNGMSYHARAGSNANSALLVGVSPEDFGGDHPLAGVAFQRRLEHAAYALAQRNGGAPYQAPAMRVGDFLATEGALDDKALGFSTAKKEVAAATAGEGTGSHPFVEPTYDRGVVWCDIRECLPDFVTKALQKALPALGKKLQGFDDPRAVMTAVESRSSSPVRIVRNDTLQAQVLGAEVQSGLYPCGEGAGYAGGIMSAACDGMRVAACVCEALRAESGA